MRRVFALASARARAPSLAACGKPFDVKTAPGFVALENQHDFD